MDMKILEKDLFGSYNFKVILIGDKFVGKTSLIKRYVFNEFQTNYRATIGSNIYVKDISIGNNNVTLTIWDIAGQQKWEVIRAIYYMGANGVLAVYDVTNEESYKNLCDKWFDELKVITIPDKIVVLGNKIDLGDKEFTDDAELKTRFKSIAHLKTSAKEGDNVENAFVELVKLLC